LRNTSPTAGTGSVNGGAALTEDLRVGLGGQGLAGGDDPLLVGHHRSAKIAAFFREGGENETQ